MTTKHIPLTIVTGFLGSGKTTLVNRILKETHGKKFAVIINEFGEIGIDDGLIQASQDFIKMDNGCLCCVLSEELISLIGKLSTRDDFESVILETTGIADPLPIAWPFLRPEFKDKFRFSGIITVADACHLETMLQQSAETKLQIERADYLYIAKTDLCGKAEWSQIQNKLRTINPNARQVFCHDTNWVQLLFDDAREFQTLVKKSDHTHHRTESFMSLSIPLKDKKIFLDDFEDFFENLPIEIFRAKAIFKNAADGRILALHSVCGRVDFYELETIKGETAVIFIGKGFDQEKIKTNFEKTVLKN